VRRFRFRPTLAEMDHASRARFLALISRVELPSLLDLLERGHWVDSDAVICPAQYRPIDRAALKAEIVRRVEAAGGRIVVHGRGVVEAPGGELRIVMA